MPQFRIEVDTKFAMAVVALSIIVGSLVARTQSLWWLALPVALILIAFASAVRSRLTPTSVAQRARVSHFERSGSADNLIVRMPRALFYAGVSTITLLTFRFLPASTLSDAFFFGSLAIAVLSGLLARDGFNLWLPPGMVVGLSLFGGGALLSGAVADNPVESMTYVVRFLIVATVWCWLGIAVLKRQRHVLNALMAWGFAGALTGAAALAQAIHGDVIPNTSPAWGRMTGFAQHVNDLGGSAATAGIASLAFFGASESTRHRLLAVALGTMCVLGVILSGSLGGMLGLLTGAGVWLLLGRFSWKNFTILTGSAVVFLFSFSFVFNMPSASVYSPLRRWRETTDPSRELGCSTCSRIETYQEGVREFLANPATGVGFDAESSTLTSGNAVHNLILQPALQGGILGLLGIVLILVAVVRLIVSGSKSSSSQYEWQIWRGISAVFACFIAFSMTAPILFTRYGWLFLVLAFSLRFQQTEMRVPTEGTDHRLAVPSSAMARRGLDGSRP